MSLLSTAFSISGLNNDLGLVYPIIYTTELPVSIFIPDIVHGMETTSPTEKSNKATPYGTIADLNVIRPTSLTLSGILNFNPNDTEIPESVKNLALSANLAGSVADNIFDIIDTGSVSTFNPSNIIVDSVGSALLALKNIKNNALALQFINLPIEASAFSNENSFYDTSWQLESYDTVITSTKQSLEFTLNIKEFLIPINKTTSITRIARRILL